MPTILIVDDDATIRQNAHFIIEKGGMKAVMASYGEEGLAKMRTTAVDLVLLDAQMPGMGGLEVLRMMRERHLDVGVIKYSAIKNIRLPLIAIDGVWLNYVTMAFG